MKIKAIIMIAVLLVAVFCPSAAAAETEAAQVSEPAVSLSDVVAERETVKINLREFGVRMEIPRLELMADANTPQTESIKAVGLTTEQLVAQGYIVYSCDEDFRNLFYVKCESDLASKHTESYNKLDEQQLADCVEAYRIDAEGYKLGEVQSTELRNYNGKSFVHIVCADSSTEPAMTTELLITVQNGVRYTFMLRVEDSAGVNAGVIDEITSSIRLSVPQYGYGLDGSIRRNAKALNCGLIVLVTVLTIAVVAMGFLLVRFSMFQKAANSSFNIFGIDVPKQPAESELEDDTQYVIEEDAIMIGEAEETKEAEKAEETEEAEKEPQK